MSIIPIVIIVLILLLVGLFVDWQKLWQNRAKAKVGGKAKGTNHSVPAQSEYFSKGKDKSTAPRNPKEELFSFDMDNEGPGIEQVVMEEESSSYFASREVEELLAEADVCFRKGEMKAAENHYLKAAAKDPRCSKAYSRLGVIYLENGDNWEDALAAFQQALKTDPGNGFILNNLGLVLYHQDRYADAIRHFEQAVRQDEFNAARHANLGMAYMAMRQYAKAESSLKRH